MGFLRIASRYKTLSLDQIGKIITILFFFLILFSNLHLKNNISPEGIDGSWYYSIKFMLFQDEKIGKDVFFTYGPLFTYLSSGPVISTSFLLNLLPQIFIICLTLLVFYLLFKITKFNFKSIIILIPLIAFIKRGISIDLASSIILLIIIFAIDTKAISLNKKNIFFFSLFTSIMFLYKFNLGVMSIGVICLLLISNLWKKNKLLFTNLFVYLINFSIFTIILFYLTTRTFNIVPFVINSLSIMSLFKEFMAKFNQSNFQYILNFIVLSGLFFGLCFLRKKNYLPYFFLCYVIFLYGWTRNDKGHIFTLLIFILTVSCIFLYTLFEKKSISNVKNNIKKINTEFVLAILLITLLHIRLLSIPINLLSFEFNQNFFENPFWKIKNGLATTNQNLEKLDSQIPISIKELVKKDNKCLMIIPNYSAIPLALNTCQIHLSNLQLYSSYTEESDQQNINILKEAYPNVKILMHNGTIDNRVYLAETPIFIRSIFKNFIVEKYENNYLLLKPNSSVWKNIECTKSNRSDYNFVKINLYSSIFEKVRKLIFKEAGICIKTKNRLTGNDLIKRTYKTQLKRGIMTEPFIYNLDDLHDYLKNSNQKSIGDFQIVQCSTVQNSYKVKNEVIKAKEEYFKCE